MNDLLAHAGDSIALCRALAQLTEEPGFTTRRFLSAPMREVHAELGQRMRRCGLTVSVDAAGNLRGSRRATNADAPALLIGSHLDTVPRAGAFDGILGVALGVKLMELLGDRPVPFAVEVIGFSEEEGVRFGLPFIGSRALIGDLDESALEKKDADGVSVRDAIRGFGADPEQLAAAAAPARALGYLEFHIEQGPVLEALGSPLGVVQSIAGQSRLEVSFEGRAGHAGTTPMHLRQDALAGAAKWIGAVEREALETRDLVATVGRVEAQPGAPNVIAGLAKATLDVRHPDDAVRRAAVERLLSGAHAIALRRGLEVTSEVRLDQPAVAMDDSFTQALADAVERSGSAAHRMHSGAGHDAMVIAKRMPAAMLFLRSPGGISHHPEESVLPEDVAAALAAGMQFLSDLESRL